MLAYASHLATEARNHAAALSDPRSADRRERLLRMALLHDFGEIHAGDRTGRTTHDISTDPQPIPRRDRHEPIVVDQDRLRIQGVVIGVLRNY